MGKRFLLSLALLAVIAACGLAQSAQSGALVGTVTTDDGSTIPGVAVTLKSPVIVMEKLTTITNVNGVFRFANLAPGTYEATFELEGFRTMVQRGLKVSILQTHTLNIKLSQEAIKEAIVVEGKGPTVDTQRQTRATNLDLEFLKSIPSARNLGLSSYINMAPGVLGNQGTGSSAGQIQSAYGGSVMDNSYSLDGVNVADPTTQTPYVDFGMDIMDEVSIQAGGLSAEFGSTRGAMVNVVTKSGGNRFSGSLFGYFTHEKLMSDNTKGTVLEGQASGSKYEVEPGFTLGGPIVKDKLWFFMNASFNQVANYRSGYPYDKETETAIKNFQPYPYLKLTFQPNAQNKFVISYNYSDLRNDHRNASWQFKEDGTVKQRSPTSVVNAQWTRYFGDNVYANLKFGMVDYLMELHAKINQPQDYDARTQHYAGGYWRNKDDNWRDRYNVNVDATTFIDNFMGTHELKVGGEVQLARTRWNIYGVPDENGACYRGLYSTTGRRRLDLVLINNGFDRLENMNDFHGFVQDTWRLNRHLTLNLGARLEYNSVVWPRQNVDEQPFDFFGTMVDRRITSSRKAFSWVNLSPRVGLIFDLFGDSKTLLKASFSRYVVPNQTAWVNLAHPNGWAGILNYYGRATLNSPWYSLGSVPWTSPANIEIGFAAKGDKLRAPYTDEVTVGFEREFAIDWSLGVRYIKKWDRRLINVVDAANVDYDKLMADGTLEWLGWSPVEALDPYNNQTYTFYNDDDPVTQDRHIVNPPGAKRDFDGVEVTLNKRLSRRWALNLSYVYANSRGLISQNYGSQAFGTSTFFQDPNAHINAIGRLPFDVRHQFKVQGLVKGPLGINLSGYFRWLQGQRWTRLITASALGLTLNQGDEQIYAEKRGSRAFDDTTLLDLRLEKAVKIGNVRVNIFADCFNVFNQGIAVTNWADSSTATATTVFNQMTAISDPRRFQLGFRLELN